MKQKIKQKEFEFVHDIAYKGCYAITNGGYIWLIILLCIDETIGV